jgi:Domain of unknown function (DUF4188)
VEGQRGRLERNQVRVRNEMSTVVAHRMAAEIDGEFVVFLIGMRINKLWKIHKWWPVFRSMRPMLKELRANPEAGLLGFTFGWPVIVQYWRSFEHLEAYARNHDERHWPVWVKFNQQIRHASGDVGIWHETYRVQAGHYEAIYSGMPPFGLGRASRLIPATGRRDTARSRMETTAVA